MTMRRMGRRDLMRGSLAAGLTATGAARWSLAATPSGGSAGPGFDLDTVRRLAMALAGEPFQDPQVELPEVLWSLGYDGYRAIHYGPRRALWAEENLPFRVQFFHVGDIHTRAVRVNVVEPDGSVAPVEYDPEFFNFERVISRDRFPETTAFAGFRLHVASQDRPGDFPEVLVFLGSSYFRLVGEGQQFGISARGLAIDTALPDREEEFPIFREFWLSQPGREADILTLYALLDSASVTGAYRFVIRPGRETTAEVTASIYTRKPVAKLGVAPLTSMFMCDACQREPFNDFRPKVHDSDGLLVATGHGEWIWRPLTNPPHLRVMSFLDDSPRGFGLMQRDQRFESYLDLEALYHKRPSLWVETLGRWGRGAVQLVEIPVSIEWHDNIAAFWVPEEPVGAGEARDFAYRLHSVLDAPHWPPAGRTVESLTGASPIDGAKLFVVDFDGGTLREIPASKPVKAVVTATGGQVPRHWTQKNEVTGGWRAYFDVLPDGEAPIEIRCHLRLGNETLTETWSYLWTR